jgi:hypothetical protein
LSNSSSGGDSKEKQSTAVLKSSSACLTDGRKSKTHGSTDATLNLERLPPTKGTEPNLNTSTKEGPFQQGTIPIFASSSFPSLLTDTYEDPAPQSILAERKTAAFLSSSENLSQPHHHGLPRSK